MASINKNRQFGLDFVTGLAGSGIETEELTIKKKKIIGTWNVDGVDSYEGDFLIKTSKKGKLKSIDVNFDYDNGVRVELDWLDFKHRKAIRSLNDLEYINVYAIANQYISSGDFQSGIDMIETIPGMGDLSIQISGNGVNLLFD